MNVSKFCLNYEPESILGRQRDERDNLKSLWKWKDGANTL